MPDKIIGFTSLASLAKPEDWPKWKLLDWIKGDDWMKNVGIMEFEKFVEDGREKTAGTLIILEDIDIKFGKNSAWSLVFWEDEDVMGIPFTFSAKPTIQIGLTVFQLGFRYQAKPDAKIYPVVWNNTTKAWEKDTVQVIAADGSTSTAFKPMNFELGAADLILDVEVSQVPDVPEPDPNLPPPPPDPNAPTRTEIDIDVDFVVNPRVNMTKAIALGNTSFVLEFEELVFYFSNQNPPVGREPGFKGISLESCVFHFPNFMVPKADESTAYIAARDLIIGTGGFSGHFELTADRTLANPTAPILMKFNVGNSEIIVESFELSFDNGRVTSGHMAGKVTFDVGDDANRIPVELKFECDITDDGFLISAEEPDGLVINIGKAVDLNVFKLVFGSLDNAFVWGLKAGIKVNYNNTKIKHGFPSEIIFERLYTGQIRLLPTWSFDNEVDEGIPLTHRRGQFKVFENSVDYHQELMLRIAKIIEIYTFRFKAGQLDTDQSFDMRLTMDGQFNFGAVTINYKGLGVDLDFNRAPLLPHYNLGSMHLTAAPVLPASFAINVEKENVVSGGGMLSIIDEGRRYEGYLMLKIFDKVTINALAIVEFETQTGLRQFSLFALMGVEFKPGIELGMGFTLTGLGGLFAYNRSMNLNKLRAEVYKPGFENLFFPSDVTKNTRDIIKAIDQVYEVTDNQYVFGPSVKITWGKPKPMIELTAAVLVQIPTFSVAMAGVLKVMLPDIESKKKILDLKGNFVAIYDHAGQELSLDGSLVDSKFLVYTITGDIVVRVKWGTQKYFLFSAGGFHPGYTSLPTNVPIAMRRLGIVFSVSDEFKMTMSSYFAVTSNTAQFGAGVRVDAKLGDFRLILNGGFDTLIYFNPYAYKVGIYLLGELKKDQRVLLALGLTANLTGPTPATLLTGAVSFTLLNVPSTYNFTWNIDSNEWDDVAFNPDFSSINVMALVGDALSIVNFITGKKYKEFATLDDRYDAAMAPLAPHKGIEISQDAVPFNVNIEKIGANELNEDFEINIGAIMLNGQELVAEVAQNDFARGVYQSLTTEQMLRLPSYETMNAGMSATLSNAVVFNQPAAAVSTNYQVFICDTDEDMNVFSTARPPQSENVQTAQALMSNGYMAVYGSMEDRVPTNTIQLNEQRYQIIFTHNGALASTASYSALDAQHFYQDLLIQHPRLQGKLQVIQLQDVWNQQFLDPAQFGLQPSPIKNPGTQKSPSKLTKQLDTGSKDVEPTLEVPKDTAPVTKTNTKKKL
jgi:hypothetical protein